MNLDVKKMLSQVYELEGLLHVIDTHADDTDNIVYEMIQEKLLSLNQLGATLNQVAIADEATTTDNTDDYKNTDSDELLDEHCEDDDEEGKDDENDYNPEEAIDAPQPDDNITLSQQDTDEAFQEFAETDDNSSLHDSDESIGEIWDSEYVEPQKTVQPEDIKDDADEEPDEETSFSDDNLRLEDVIQRNISKDLSQAFSINDRFRYRRELFSNSEVEMKEAIDLVDTMQSYSEAEDYFYGDLQWDKDSPEVTDFMVIIRNHFS